MGKNFGLGAKAGHIRFFNEFSVSDLFGMEQKVKNTKNWTYPVFAIYIMYRPNSSA